MAKGKEFLRLYTMLNMCYPSYLALFQLYPSTYQDVPKKES